MHRKLTVLICTLATATIALLASAGAVDAKHAAYPYTLIDLGTLGGPQAGFSNPPVLGRGDGVLPRGSRHGAPITVWEGPTVRSAAARSEPLTPRPLIRPVLRQDRPFPTSIEIVRPVGAGAFGCPARQLFCAIEINRGEKVVRLVIVLILAAPHDVLIVLGSARTSRNGRLRRRRRWSDRRP